MSQAGLRAAVVLAAGRGTRLRSSLHKMLHPIAGRPLGAWPIAAALEAGCDRVVVVVGHQAEEVEVALRRELPQADLVFAIQEVQDGTGGAVLAAREALAGADELLILAGDVPLLDGTTLGALITSHELASRESGRSLTVLTFEVDDPSGYGRVISDDAGAVRRIVEARDTSPEERAVRTLNSGVYLGEAPAMLSALGRCGTNNDQGEVYLTDIVELMAEEGALVGAHPIAEAHRVEGVNTRAQLAALEARMLDERRLRLMEAGVTMEEPATVRVDHDVIIGRDTVLGPSVQLLEGTVVGEGCHIEAGVVLRRMRIGARVHLKPYVVAQDSILEEGAVAGPFAHIRPGTRLGEGAKIGNFVEAKKALIGRGSKASHLTYLGDCELGEGVNVGAGTITCNYDGSSKHRTVLEDGVFIGSNTELVAPVRVGRRATVAAGSTVTRDVPAGALMLSRAPEVVREGYDDKHRRPREEARARAKAAKAAADEEST